jgi:hypothetical protein
LRWPATARIGVLGPARRVRLATGRLLGSAWLLDGWLRASLTGARAAGRRAFTSRLALPPGRGALLTTFPLLLLALFLFVGIAWIGGLTWRWSLRDHDLRERGLRLSRGGQHRRQRQRRNGRRLTRHLSGPFFCDRPS